MTQGLRLSRFERVVHPTDGPYRRSVNIDWRGALTDALLGHNINSREVVEEFERLCLNPSYEETA